MTIKDINEDAYDDITGEFIDAASAEYFRDHQQMKRKE